MKILWLKRRRYPVKRDEYGQSARQRAFELFREGNRPAQVSQLLPISTRTACRYFEDWKKLTHKVPFAHIKKLVKKNPETSEYVIGMFADYFGVPPEQVILRMQKPWGLMQLLKAEFPNARIKRAKTRIERRLETALRLILLADSLYGKGPEAVNKEIGKILFSTGTEDSEYKQE